MTTARPSSAILSSDRTLWELPRGTAHSRRSSGIIALYVSNRHRDMLEQIFERPTSGNVAVAADALDALLEAIGTVV